MNLKLRLGPIELVWLSWLEYTRRGRKDGRRVLLGSVGPFPICGPWSGIIYVWRVRAWRFELRRLASR